MIFTLKNFTKLPILRYLGICNVLHTVFIRIVAAATINFGLAGVRLLIEGGFCLFWKDTLRHACADPVVSCCDKLAFQDYFLNS